MLPSDLWIVLAAAGLLSLERVCYIWIWHAPDKFRAVCARRAFGSTLDPVDAVRLLFLCFKAVQGVVFIGWCWTFGAGRIWPTDAPAQIAALGVSAMFVGQVLNVSVFRRLGMTGVFYGNRFGYTVPQCRAFPFSLFRHPQYLGTLLSIWGFFLVMRFPHPDWFILPVLETAYYTVGARLEQS